MILVKWTYTKAEWDAFIRNKTRGRFLSRIYYFLFGRVGKMVPSVHITPEKVWIGEEQQYFSSGRHQLKQIDLRHEGNINILSIIYDREGGSHEIKIPVPRGKLREAIEVQDRLMPGY